MSDYATIERLLGHIVQETDWLISKADKEPWRRSSIAREVYRRIGNCGQEIMERCCVEPQSLEERLGWKEMHATPRD